jgi:hypothetical protein
MAVVIIIDFGNYHHHHHKHQGLDPLIRSVSRGYSCSRQRFFGLPIDLLICLFIRFVGVGFISSLNIFVIISHE